ncbi:MAG TPA: deoxyribodipyrimidine photo-lyase [Methylobacterium sp.]|jgi:deoxyribodipyrimidine photo-lyase|uniref:deoxyribodipyrimidine photo-lyase n=1 Tax=Methylorubrum sp. B1-46 TaxID=2897334 RepID=UPI001E29FBD0|nr:deoxyribodipyrimidine photo-lyase [Methylorubrum sp. B1-46]UGB23830.1 deoxyribodipyrimidine photo-lyase [Methylorubrum sp. B1-46]HEV2545437.1 deoxyribodipyrimidine photo-lyase [Methylobacterium sp.]
MAIQPARIRVLNDRPPRDGSDYVLYLMQQAMRVPFNPALELAIEEANRLKLPLLVCFGLLDGANGFPEANARHYAFLLQGLADAATALDKRGIAFLVRRGTPAKVAIDLSEGAALLVLDRGYLAIQKRWYGEIEQKATCRIVQVEGDVVVPVETASTKHEYAARTLRPKLQKLWDDFLEPLARRTIEQPAGGLIERLKRKDGLDVSNPDRLLAKLTLDTTVGPVKRFRGGHTEAGKRLKRFVKEAFAGYGAGRNKPEAGAASHMSPYLHFGHISPVEIALAIRAAKDADGDDRSAYLEELIVRRELAMNHVFHTQGYDDYARAVPDWARKTLAEHADDERPTLYSEAELAEGKTHDHYWNVAMREMRETGYMHNQLRMYWGKKILEWSPSPEEAFARTLRLNNRYFLDGRDANSFTNVAWIFGLHDRPWQTRKIFGSVRYQSENSLRKFDAKGYERAVTQLCEAEKN